MITLNFVELALIVVVCVLISHALESLMNDRDDYKESFEEEN